MAVATSIAAVVVLAAAVLVPRVLAERQPTADRPLPLPRSVVTKPDQGFELTIPDGWKISELDGPLGLLLVPARPSTTKLPAMIMVRTDVLDPLIYPGPRPATASGSPPPTSGRPVPGGPFTEGRRADGRWFARSDHAKQLADAWQQRYQLAWPYRCAKGARCPREARYEGCWSRPRHPAAKLKRYGRRCGRWSRRCGPSATPSTAPSRSPPGAPAGSPAGGTPRSISSCRLPTPSHGTRARSAWR